MANWIVVILIALLVFVGILKSVIPALIIGLGLGITLLFVWNDDDEDSDPPPSNGKRYYSRDSWGTWPFKG